MKGRYRERGGGGGEKKRQENEMGQISYRNGITKGDKTGGRMSIDGIEKYDLTKAGL